MTKAILIDRDGVLVEDIGYHHKTEDFKLIPNAIEGLKLLKNFKLIIITNQSGIGRGYFTMKDFENFNNHLIKEIKKHNIQIEKIYVCPHAPEDNCECRKPKTKMLKDAEKELNINLKKSFVIGDKKMDIDLGKNAGCRTILVLTGNGMKEKENSDADYVAKDLLDAAKWILNNKKMPNINKKIITLKQLIKIVQKLKKQGKKIVTTNGVFDILHLGHVKYLEEAKRLGDVLIVGVNTDASVRQIKGDKRPINDEKSRIGVLAGLESVDYVFLFNEKDPTKWLSNINPHIHVKAGDYKPSKIIEKGVVEKNGGKIIIAKIEKGYSTTRLINKIIHLYKNQ